MKLPISEKSSLLVGGKVNPRRQQLHQRAEKFDVDVSDDGLCLECDALLTEADVENGACTQCGCVLANTDDDSKER